MHIIPVCAAAAGRGRVNASDAASRVTRATATDSRERREPWNKQFRFHVP